MKAQGTYVQPRYVIATFLIVAIIIISMRTEQFLHATRQIQQSGDNELLPRRDVIWTAKGPATYEEVDQNVFRPNNFRITEYAYPIPKLEFIEKCPCAKTFQDWLAIANGEVPEQPPRVIEEKDKDAFLLNGYTELREDSYHTRPTQPGGVVWNKKLQEMIAAPNPIVKYHEGLAVYYALRDYPVANMTGFVIGSQSPWVEVQALRNGAAKVLTVEYRETKVLGTDKIVYFHPIKFAEEWRKSVDKYDFAISFSSIEHSGLGRYGDVIDPIGDLREAQKVLCLLRRGGLFYFGVPRGKDAIVYNAHRIYGRMRLAMIMTGFEWLATYGGDNPHSEIRVEDDYKEMSLIQDLYVLKKI